MASVLLSHILPDRKRLALAITLFQLKVAGLPSSSLGLRRHAHGPLAKHLMHMAHKSGNTSGVSKSSSDWLNYTGFPGDACVAFFNVPPRNKDAVMPNPLMKKKAFVFTTVKTSAYQDQLKAGFSKVCEIFKVHGIESLKYVREFYTAVCYCGDISTL